MPAHAASRQFVMALDLPAAPLAGPSFESDAPVVNFTSEQQAVTIGSQLAEFSPKVGPDLRSAVADSLLLAQLAANKATAMHGDVMAWYDTYVKTVQGLGWLAQSLEFKTQQVSNEQLGVHNAIIPVLTAMLGPAAAAISLVVTVLNGLQDMDRSKPWITLFDRSSQHSTGAKFQFGFVDVDDNGNPKIQLLAVAVDANSKVTQVLFFKFTDNSATLNTGNSLLGADLQRLQAIRDLVAQRVQPFQADFISKLDI